MKKTICAVGLIGLLLGLAIPALADEPVYSVRAGFEAVQLTGKFWYLPSARPITAMPSGALLKQFKPCQSAVPIFQDRTQWHCVYFRLRNESSVPVDARLLIDTHSIDSVQVSVCQEGNCQSFPMESVIDSTRPLIGEANHDYPLHLTPGRDYAVLINLVNNISWQRLRLPLVLIEANHYTMFTLRRDLFRNGYIGALLFVMLFVFALFLIFGERIYLYYTLYLVGLTLFFICRQNHIAYFTGSAYFFTSFWLIQWGAYSLLANSYAGFAVLYLNARQYAPAWLFKSFSMLRKLLLLMVLPTPAIILFNRTDLLLLYAPFTVGVIALMLLGVWGLVLSAVRQHYQPAYLFGIGYTPVALVVIIIDPANEAGYLGQDGVKLFYATHIFEIFVLTLGLVLRFKAVFTDKERLQEEIKQQEQLRLESIIQIQEEERKRLAADLHDDLGATLSVIKGQLETVPVVSDQLATPINLMKKAIQDLRYISHDLMPPEFAKLGLLEAIQETVRRAQAGSDLQFQFITYGQERRLDNQTELTIYRIGTELINNAVKHAKANQVIIQLIFYPDAVSLMVEDDGQGYSLSEDKNQAGIGLRNISSRVMYLGAKLLVDSGERGTTVTLEVPL